MLVLTVNIVGESRPTTVGMAMKFKFVHAANISLSRLFSC